MIVLNQNIPKQDAPSSVTKPGFQRLNHNELEHKSKLTSTSILCYTNKKDKLSLFFKLLIIIPLKSLNFQLTNDFTRYKFMLYICIQQELKMAIYVLVVVL